MTRGTHLILPIAPREPEYPSMYMLRLRYIEALVAAYERNPTDALADKIEALFNEPRTATGRSGRAGGET